ncbi:sulfatase [Algoriphagus sp. AGSA1]|uniref:sulfatase family protein n=1 Tax=Algoriphagus sp. AGSA1 TaxID=2907213 RepID=UPI001F29CD0D|nr:sulfatase [Algoriphagus sp. AGSA1]MCE7054249.1 sulfatase [Algoriphagus sp. AGSA1]
MKHYCFLILLTFYFSQDSIGQSRPNIVLFIADDLGAIDLPLYGNPMVRTPNLDKLGEESLIFTNAFATSPTCSPSRASIHTGLMPFRNGAHANHSGIKEGIKTLPAYLKEIGYRVGIAGKYHLGPVDAFPFEMIHGTNIPEPGYEDKGELWTDLVVDPVEDWLSTPEDGSGKPFLLVVNDHSPHVFWPENPEYAPSEVEIPTIHIDTEETRLARAKYFTDITKMDSNVGKLISILESQNLEQNTVFIFTSDQGPQWAFGKWNLYDYGVKVPLLVRWPGIITGGTDTDALVSLVDLLPTFLELAEGEAPQSPEIIDGISFLPLLLGQTNRHRDYLYASHTGDGDMNRTPIRMIRNKRYKYILNLAPEVRYTTHMDKGVTQGYWPTWIEKSFQDDHARAVLGRYHNRPLEEFYDVIADPNETRNLAFNQHYQEMIKRFRSSLSEWRNSQGDKETDSFDEKNANLVRGGPYIFK